MLFMPTETAPPSDCTSLMPSPTAVPPFRGSSFSGAGEMPKARTMSRLAWKPPSAITTAVARKLA